MTELQGVFLDFYGTLVGGDRQAVESICQSVIDDHGLEITCEDLSARWGKAYFAGIEAVDGTGFKCLSDLERDTLIETIAPRVSPVSVDKYINDLNEFLQQPILFDEVHEVIETLDVPTCIVSNADERELRAAVRHHQINVDYVVSSESARSYKPEPHIFNVALERTGWSADRIIHVGDSLHSDVGGAHKAGIRAAWVIRADRIGDIGTETPDFTWTDLRPLCELT